MNKYIAILVLSCFFVSCNSGKREAAAVAASDSSSKAAKPAPAAPRETGYYTVDGDSLVIPAVEINVALSEQASHKLAESKETIIVNAIFTGQPKDTTSQEYLENGEMFVASSKKEITYGQAAKFENVKFSRKLYDALADKDIQLLINVYSGRRSTPENLLDCEILQDKMSRLGNKSFTLKGKLIKED